MGDIKIDVRLFLSEFRFQTFKNNWPFKGHCAPLKMAEAGFYCVSSRLEDPTVKCIVCEKELDGWNEQDIPFEEHKKHAPTCLFVKKIIAGKSCNTLTVEDLLEMYKFLIETRLKKQLNKNDEIFANFIEELNK